MNDVLIVGLGGAGCSIVSQIKMAAGIRRVVIDVDRKALQSLDTQFFSETLLIGSKSCGGLAANVPKRGRRAAEESRAELDALLTGTRLLIIVAGLGGGTSSGALPLIVQIAQAQNIEVLVAATLPFSAETARREIALATLNELKDGKVSVQIHDLALADKASSVDSALEESNRNIEQIIAKWMQQDHPLKMPHTTNAVTSSKVVEQVGLAPPPPAKLVVAISSRALFNLDESHAVFENEGVEAYCCYQVEREEIPLEPGVAFSLVKKLLALNERDPCDPRVEVILLSRNNADTGLRIFNSIKHHHLNISRAAFTRGESTHPYISAFGAQLFLSAEPGDVRRALEAGFAAATILPSAATPLADADSAQLRIAFDGDAVLFSDESERIYKQEGLGAFEINETNAAKQPLPGGPFKNFLAMLHRIQLDYPADTSPIRTALITARGAPAHERVIRTLRAWNIRIDEALFLGGMDKGAFLKAFGADIFFDDQHKHCESARKHVATGHVPHGVAND